MGEFWSKMDYRRLYSRSTSWSYPRNYEVRGLFNDSLSCCVNSLLQSFSATTELLDILNKWNPSGGTKQSSIPLQLKNALLAMRDSSHPAPHRDFLESLYRHGICRHTQQDADEIFHIILNLTQKQMPDLCLAQEIRSLYEIKVETQVKCSHCTSIQRCTSSLFSLPLAICEGGNTLESCINSYFKLQNLVDGEENHCNQCEKKQPSTHVANDGPRADEHYSLYAVIVHIGYPMCGHYTAYVRPAQDQTWYYANDSCVQPATWADVQCTYKGDNTAYLLLYRKKGWNSSG